MKRRRKHPPIALPRPGDLYQLQMPAGFLLVTAVTDIGMLWPSTCRTWRVEGIHSVKGPTALNWEEFDGAWRRVMRGGAS